MSRSESLVLAWQRYRDHPDRLLPCNVCGSSEVYYSRTHLCKACYQRTVGRRYTNTHRGLINANSEKYRQGHRLQRSNLEAARRARKRQNGVLKFDIQDIIERDGGVCGICAKKVKKAELSIDHILPLVHGGAHIPSNVQVAHKSCNFRKGAGCLPSQMRLALEV